MSETDSARYFQEIGRRFLQRRGAPFFLSAKDLALVSDWERSGIPLAVVLEGIDQAFAARPGGAPPRGKILSLSFCRSQVERAFERERDRKVGGTRHAPAPQRDKGARIKAEVEKFLGNCSGDLDFLKSVLLQARQELDKASVAGEALESLETELERLLLAEAGPEERAAVCKDIQAEHTSLRGAAFASAVDLALVKRLRDRHKIPYLSPFYY